MEEKISVLDYWRSYWSMLSGGHAKRDSLYGRVKNEWYEHKGEQDLKAYYREINRDGEIVKVRWIEGVYGAYTIIDRPLPLIGKGRAYYHYNASCALFSPDPEILYNVLCGDLSLYDQVVSLPIHTHQDLSSYDRVSYSPFLHMIRRHYMDYGVHKAKRAVYQQESNRLLRSDNAVIFERNGSVFLYLHPQAEDGLFVSERMIDNPIYFKAIQPFCIKTNTDPISADKIRDHMIEVADNVERDFDLGESPCQRYIQSASGFTRMRKRFSQGLRVGIQPLTHLLARLNKSDLLSGGFSAALGAIIFALSSAALTGFKSVGFAVFSVAGLRALIAGNNVIAKGVSGVSRFFSKILKQTRKNDISRLYDYGPDFTSSTKLLDLGRRIHYPMRKGFFECIKLVSSSAINATKLDTYTEKDKSTWVALRQKSSAGINGAAFIRVERTGNTIDLHVSGSNGAVKKYSRMRQPDPVIKSEEICAVGDLGICADSYRDKAKRLQAAVTTAFNLHHRDNWQSKLMRERARKIKWHNPIAMSTIPRRRSSWCPKNDRP